MDTTVIAALIGAAGAVGGAVVKAVTPELKPLLTGKARANSDLVHRWNCRWSARPENGGDNIDDVVTISKVWGEKFWGQGINAQYGGYVITGRISRSSLVTLHYTGVDQRQPLGGVVIMKLNATREEMNGYWYEYGREEKIV